MDDHNIGEQDGSDSGAGGSQDNDNMEDDEESKGNLDADEQLASLLQIDKSSHVSSAEAQLFLINCAVQIENYEISLFGERATTY